MTDANETPIDTDALAQGSRVDEYLIESVLGTGGFGITYKATDTHLNIDVALKEYFPLDWSYRGRDGVTVHPKAHGQKAGGDGKTSHYDWGLERFLEEARVLACIQHPYVVRVRRFFRANGTAYIVMDYEAGDPLGAFLGADATLTEAEIRGILEDVLPALQAVHEQGYLHRDVKPDNLYVRARDNRVMLIDFGAARQALGRRSMSVISLVSPGYSPPEQYTSGNDRYGSWTDIYALGAVLYRCISGKLPPDAATRLLEDCLKPAVEVGAGRYSPAFLAAVDRALAIQPKNRFQTVEQFRVALYATPADDADNASRPAVESADTATADTVLAKTPHGWEMRPSQPLFDVENAASEAPTGPPAWADSAAHEGADESPDTTQPIKWPFRWHRTVSWRRIGVVTGIAVFALLAGAVALRLTPSADQTVIPRYTLKDGLIQLNQPAPVVTPPSSSDKTPAPVARIPTPPPITTMLAAPSTDPAPPPASALTTTPPLADAPVAPQPTEDTSTETPPVANAPAETPSPTGASTEAPPVADASTETSPPVDTPSETEPVADAPTDTQPAEDTAMTESQPAEPDSSAVAEGPSSRPAVTEKTTEPSAEHTQIGRLLAKAQDRLDNDRLTQPTRDSALHYYRRVLALDPDNRSAVKGIAAIGDAYQRLAREALDRGRYRLAREYVAKGLEVTPRHPELVELRGQLTQSVQRAPRPPRQAYQPPPRQYRPRPATSDETFGQRILRNIKGMISNNRSPDEPVGFQDK